MSTATRLDRSAREARYFTQTGRTELTPTQRRRADHKDHEALRPHGRYGRLRRRYNKVDDRTVRVNAYRRNAETRAKIQYAQHSPKPAAGQKRAAVRAAIRSMLRRAGDR